MSRMATETRLMWRHIRDAGPLGIPPAGVRALVPHMSAKLVSGRLNNLCRLGYVAYAGDSKRGVWRIGTRLPLGEVATVGAPTLTIELLDDAQAAPARSPTWRFALPTVPNSIWHLADICGGTA